MKSSQNTDLRDAPAAIAKIEIRTVVRVGSSKPQHVDLSLTLRANQSPAEIAADVTEFCRQVRDEVQGILK